MKDAEVTFIHHRSVKYLLTVSLISCNDYQKHFERKLSASILRASEFPGIYTHKIAI
jgi:hypothetical protein